MNICTLKNCSKIDGMIKYQYCDEEINIALIENHLKSLNMFFYQIQNLSQSPIAIDYGYKEYKNAKIVEPNQIVDVEFANIIDDKVDDKMFYSLIRNNIFSYDKWLEITKSKSR